MKSYKEIYRNIAGDFPSSPPEMKRVFYAYKEGKVLGKGNSLEDIRRNFGANVITEKVVSNQKEIHEYWERKKLIDDEAFSIWFSIIQQAYDDLPIELFNVCYAEAYERGHSSGFDEITHQMHEVVEFAKKVLESVNLK